MVLVAASYSPMPCRWAATGLPLTSCASFSQNGAWPFSHQRSQDTLPWSSFPSEAPRHPNSPQGSRWGTQTRLPTSHLHYPHREKWRLSREVNATSLHCIGPWVPGGRSHENQVLSKDRARILSLLRREREQLSTRTVTIMPWLRYPHGRVRTQPACRAGTQIRIPIVSVSGPRALDFGTQPWWRWLGKRP